jgi:hypothetical protein
MEENEASSCHLPLGHYFVCSHFSWVFFCILFRAALGGSAVYRIFFYVRRHFCLYRVAQLDRDGLFHELRGQKIFFHRLFRQKHVIGLHHSHGIPAHSPCKNIAQQLTTIALTIDTPTFVIGNGGWRTVRIAVTNITLGCPHGADASPMEVDE